MKIIRPFEITPALVTTNVVNIEPTWDINTNYFVGEFVAWGDYVYQAVQDSGPGVPEGGIEPGTDTDDDGEVDSYYWLIYSATNPYNAFYQSVGHSSKGVDGMQYVIRPGQETTGIALFQIVGFNVHIVVEDTPGDVRYDKTFTLVSTADIYDWSTYFFDQLENVDNIVDFALPAGLPDPIITVTVSADAQAEIGELVVGESIDLGYTQKNPTIGIVDYSTKNVDEFGNIDIVAKPYSQKASLSLLVMTENINYVSRVLTLIRSQPVVWGVLEDVNFVTTVLIYGYLKDYNMSVPHAVWASLSLQIEGLT